VQSYQSPDLNANFGPDFEDLSVGCDSVRDWDVWDVRDVRDVTAVLLVFQLDPAFNSLSFLLVLKMPHRRWLGRSSWIPI
jgi:hypothetical protein